MRIIFSKELTFNRSTLGSLNRIASVFKTDIRFCSNIIDIFFRTCGSSFPFSSNRYISEKGCPNGFFCNLLHFIPAVNSVVQVVGWVGRINDICPIQNTEMPKEEICHKQNSIVKENLCNCYIFKINNVLRMSCH